MIWTAAGVWSHNPGLNKQWSSNCLSSRSELVVGQVTRYFNHILTMLLLAKHFIIGSFLIHFSFVLI